MVTSALYYAGTNSTNSLSCLRHQYFFPDKCANLWRPCHSRTLYGRDCRREPLLLSLYLFYSRNIGFYHYNFSRRAMTMTGRYSTSPAEIRGIYIQMHRFLWFATGQGNTGTTGTSATATGLTQCAGTSFPTFSGMPTLIVGHEYLLLVSNFSASQKGYDLKFSGGTAVITDPMLPAIAGAKIDCGATEITIGLNKKMRCNTVAANGSDFSISPSGTIVSAAGVNCSSSFDFDSVRLTLSAPLPPGNYTVTLKAGSDGNTIADNCNTEILAGSTTAFTVLPQAAISMGTLTPPACTPSSLVLNFTDPIKCTSIAGNGSDFAITGPGAVTVTGATANCNASGFATAITIQTSGPILTPGNYQVVMQQGSDGNTLLGDCNRQVNAGQSAAFCDHTANTFGDGDRSCAILFSICDHP